MVPPTILVLVQKLVKMAGAWGVLLPGAVTDLMYGSQKPQRGRIRRLNKREPMRAIFRVFHTRIWKVL
jgi:hypothetical protein